MLQPADPTGLEHFILAGGRIGASPPRPLTSSKIKHLLSHAKLTQVLGLAFGLRKLFERRPDQTTLKRKIQPKES